ncbi:MAG: hypothetical protein IPN88_16200 [Bacteroidetes bacterium]|nr:hypothetical protein [Bacteroidota bacterium]
MRPLLLLTNCIVHCALLLSCQTPTKKNSEIELKTASTIVAKDSLVNGRAVIQKDTTKTIINISTNSDKKTPTVNSANSINEQTINTKPTQTQTKRIEHASDNQAKLDSIKKAKGELKKIIGE